MSDFTYQPALGFQSDSQPRVEVIKLGDSYEQRVGDGINNDLRSWQLTFNRETSDIQAIETQLRGYGAVTSFTWTPPDESQIRVVCRKHSRVRGDINVQTITATFDEVIA